MIIYQLNSFYFKWIHKYWRKHKWLDQYQPLNWISVHSFSNPYKCEFFSFEHGIVRVQTYGFFSSPLVKCWITPTIDALYRLVASITLSTSARYPGWQLNAPTPRLWHIAIHYIPSLFNKIKYLIVCVTRVVRLHLPYNNCTFTLVKIPETSQMPPHVKPPIKITNY